MSARAAGATCCRRWPSTRSRSTGVEINEGILDLVNRPIRRLHRPPRSRPARQFRQRRGAQLHRAPERAGRHHPDFADRHLGRHRQRRVRAHRELALHRRGLADFPRSPGAARNSDRVALVLRESARRGLPARGARVDDADADGRRRGRPITSRSSGRGRAAPTHPTASAPCSCRAIRCRPPISTCSKRSRRG